MWRVGLVVVLWCSGPALADRAAQAKEHTEAGLRSLFREKGLAWPPQSLFLRAFKAESTLEVWAGPKGKPLTLVKAYPVCAASGELGPKRREGDLQVPEGFYEVGRLNPTSSYHLSLEVTYPNASDKVLSNKKRPGGNIYLHGSCVSIGCIAIEDGPIEEVYTLASLTKRPIPFHVFPKRLDEAAMASLEGPHLEFWKQLAVGYRLFEDTKVVPTPKVHQKTGAYEFLLPRRPQK